MKAKQTKTEARKKSSYKTKPKDAAFYVRLEEMQEKRGVQWDRLGEVIGLKSPSGMTLKRDKKYAPTLYEVEQWAAALGCSPTWLAWGVGPQDAMGDEIWKIASLTATLPFDHRAELLNQLRTKSFGRQSPTGSVVILPPRADLEKYQRGLLYVLERLDARKEEFDWLNDLLRWLANLYAPRQSQSLPASILAGGETGVVNAHVAEENEESRNKSS